MMLSFLNMSGGEILLIVLVAYLVLGPKKIPEIARMIGKGINELRRATDDIRHEINKEVTNIKKEADLNIKDPFIPDAYKGQPGSDNNRNQKSYSGPNENETNTPETDMK